MEPIAETASTEIYAAAAAARSEETEDERMLTLYAVSRKNAPKFGALWFRVVLTIFNNSQSMKSRETFTENDVHIQLVKCTFALTCCFLLSGSDRNDVTRGFS